MSIKSTNGTRYKNFFTFKRLTNDQWFWLHNYLKIDLNAKVISRKTFKETTPLQAAIRNGHFVTWPGLEAKLIEKSLLHTVATAKGHLDQEKKNLQSTKLTVIQVKHEDDKDNYFPQPTTAETTPTKQRPRQHQQKQQRRRQPLQGPQRQQLHHHNQQQ